MWYVHEEELLNLNTGVSIFYEYDEAAEEWYLMFVGPASDHILLETASEEEVRRAFSVLAAKLSAHTASELFTQITSLRA